MSALSETELARLRASQRVLQHAIATATAPDDILAAQQAGYPELHLTPEDAEVVAATDIRSLMLYRNLVRATLRETIALQMPRTVARLPEAVFEADTARYFEHELPRSRLLRDVPYEFASWASQAWRDNPEVFAYLPDLARFELFEFDVYTAPRKPLGWPVAEVHGEQLPADKGVAFDGSVRVARFDHAVHQLSDDEEDRTAAAAGSFGILGYRDSENSYRQMELTPIATSLMLNLLAGQPLASALRESCEAHQKDIDQEVIAGTSEVLADLAEREVLLGACSIAAPPPSPSPWFRWLVDGRAS